MNNAKYSFILNLLKQVPMADDIYYESAKKCVIATQFKDKETEKEADMFLDKALDKFLCDFKCVDLIIKDKQIFVEGNNEVDICMGVHTPFVFCIKNEDVDAYNFEIEYPKDFGTCKDYIDPWNIRAKNPLFKTFVETKGFIPFTLYADSQDINKQKLGLIVSLNGMKKKIDLKLNKIESKSLKINVPDGKAMIEVKTDLNTYEVLEEKKNHLNVLPGGVLPFLYTGKFIDMDKDFEIRVPKGKVELEIYKGFEYERKKIEILVENDKEIDIHLDQKMDLYSKKWISSDPHVHWANMWVYLGDDTKRLKNIQRCRDIHIISVLELSQFDGYQEVFTPVHHPAGLIKEHSNDDYIMYMDEEYRSIPYGHINVLGLNKIVTPVSTGQTKHKDAFDYPDNFYIAKEAKKQKALIFCSHGIRAFDKIMLGLGIMDGADQALTKDYYRLLNCGLRFPITLGSDANAREMGGFRTYVKVDKELTYKNWIEGIRSGKTFVTTRPLIDFKVNGKEPGCEIYTDKDIDIDLEAYCDIPLHKLQIVLNGEIIFEKENIEKKQTIKINKKIRVNETGWIVARCSIDDNFEFLEHKACAHTSPVYINYKNQEFKIRKDEVKKVIEEINEFEKNMIPQCVFKNDKQKHKVLEHINSGREKYKNILK